MKYPSCSFMCITGAAGMFERPRAEERGKHFRTNSQYIPRGRELGKLRPYAPSHPHPIAPAKPRTRQATPQRSASATLLLPTRPRKWASSALALCLIRPLTALAAQNCASRDPTLRPSRSPTALAAQNWASRDPTLRPSRSPTARAAQRWVSRDPTLRPSRSPTVRETQKQADRGYTLRQSPEISIPRPYAPSKPPLFSREALKQTPARQVLPLRNPETAPAPRSLPPGCQKTTAAGLFPSRGRSFSYLLFFYTSSLFLSFADLLFRRFPLCRPAAALSHDLFCRSTRRSPQ